MSQSISLLNDRYATDGLVFEQGNGQLPKAVVSTAQSRGEVYLHGAHVTSFHPTDAEEMLFVSGKSFFQDGAPIRGGIPICFPWFGPHESNPHAPSHGMARTRAWKLENASVQSGQVSLELSNLFGPLATRFTVRLGEQLEMKFQVKNTGSTQTSYEAALHSYFRVSDIKQIEIAGLERISHYDQLQRNIQPPNPAPITFEQEVDRIYLSTTESVTLRDPGMQREIIVEKQGSHSTVVWNPWVAKSERMEDFGNDEWPFMCCIETANIGEDRIHLRRGQKHEMVAIHRIT